MTHMCSALFHETKNSSGLAARLYAGASKSEDLIPIYKFLFLVFYFCVSLSRATRVWAMKQTLGTRQR